MLESKDFVGSSPTGPTIRLMKRKSKCTKEMMEPIISRSVSLAGVLRELDLVFTGGNYQNIKRIIGRLEIDISHFKGKLTNSGPSHTGGSKKIGWEEILVLDRRSGYKERIPKLREAMIFSGIKEECEICLIPPIWNDKKLVLHIDHINGNPVDNRPGNPRFLCPNCHSQTENYGSKNIKKSLGVKGKIVNKKRISRYLKGRVVSTYIKTPVM